MTWLLERGKMIDNQVSDEQKTVIMVETKAKFPATMNSEEDSQNSMKSSVVITSVLKK